MRLRSLYTASSAMHREGSQTPIERRIRDQRSAKDSDKDSDKGSTRNSENDSDSILYSDKGIDYG